MPKSYGQFEEEILELSNDLQYEISQLIRKKLADLNKENQQLSPNTYVQFRFNSDDLDIAVNRYCNVDEVLDAISIVPDQKGFNEVA
jgi:hypothetical protein